MHRQPHSGSGSSEPDGERGQVGGGLSPPDYGWNRSIAFSFKIPYVTQRLLLCVAKGQLISKANFLVSLEPKPNKNIS